ncbi:26S proteasome non-ATPase regulatory subunit 5 [Umbelopsis sp. PMI_123]|nr:26S proteasome non-ATPase regulatory subunit 5 [Umbelopsis sp. PMI_123]
MSNTKTLLELNQVLDPRSGSTRQQSEVALQQLLSTIGETLTLEQSNKILENISLANLFYHGDSEEDVGAYAREAIRRVLWPIPYETIATTEYKSYLVQGLSHFSPDVRKLSLQQVEKCLANEQASSLMAKSDIFVFVLTTLSFQSSDVAEEASELIYKVALTEDGLNEFFRQQSIGILKAISTIDETIKFRVYELIIKVAGSSEKGFELAENDMLLDNVIAEVKSDDILIKINAIEMFMEMATSPPGYQFLKKANLLSYLVGLMKNEDGSESSVTVCAAIKFFGRLVSVKGVNIADIDADLGIVDIWKNILSNANDDTLIVTIATIGLIGTSADAVRLLNERGLLDEFSSNFRSSAGHIKVGYLQSLSQLFAVHALQETNSDIEKITEALFHNMGGSAGPVELLISLAQQPLEEMRIAVFAVLESIATHQWGQRELTQSRKFLDYILNRTTETTHAGKTWKFSIVKALTMTPKAEANIEPMALRRLAEYVKQGPFYIHREAAVAMEMG